MKLAIMQPYIFPYIGYYQLINAADRFVIYDTVTFIKQGWINRNRILLNGSDFTFTVPVQSVSSFVNIADTEINARLYPQWRDKFFKTLAQAYAKAPHYKAVSDLVMTVFKEESASVSRLAAKSLFATCDYLGIDTTFVPTSAHYANSHLKAQERVIDICKKENADVYINVSAGRELYAKPDFENEGIKLQFIRTGSVQYKQFGNDFVPWLSAIDVLMFNTPGEIMALLQLYQLE